MPIACTMCRSEFNRGEMVPAFERPSRADNVLAALKAAKLGPLEAPKEFSLEHAYAVHDRGDGRFPEGRLR